MDKYSKYLNNKSPEVSHILDELFKVLDEVTNKDYIVEEKQTSLHIVKNSAFLGVHFLKNIVRITIVLNHSVSGSKVHASLQASKSRFYNDLNLASVEDLDNEIKGYIKEAYNLKTQK